MYYDQQMEHISLNMMSSYLGNSVDALKHIQLHKFFLIPSVSSVSIR